MAGDCACISTLADRLAATPRWLFPSPPFSFDLVRIALVILHADARRGGAERYTFDLAAALIRRGHAVSFLASSFYEPPAGADRVDLPTKGISRRGRYLSFLDSLDAHLAAEHYDVVHAMLPVRRCDLYHPHAGIEAATLAESHEKHENPAIGASARILNRLNRKRRAVADVERTLLGGPNPPLVLCLSDYIRRAALRHHQIDPSRLLTLYNGIDTKRFDPADRHDAGRELRQRLGIADDRVVALLIAQDFQRKGLRQTIDAIARLARPELVLLVVGRPDPGRYQRQATRLGVASQMIFAGPTTDPYPFYFRGRLLRPPHAATTRAAWWCWRRWPWASPSSAPPRTEPAS